MCYTINMLLLGGNEEIGSLDISQHIGIDNLKVECANIPDKNLKTVDEECLSFLEMSDVIAVVVDTPSLMEASNPVSDHVNRVEAIQNLLHDIIGDEKMVVFVPVKCGKWMKERRMKEVLDKLTIAFQSSIKSLCTCRWTEYCIIPTESIEDALHQYGQLMWHTVWYMAKKWAAETKSMRRLGVHYVNRTTGEKIMLKLDELESEGVFLKRGGYISIDNWYEFPVIMEDFDELYGPLPSIEDNDAPDIKSLHKPHPTLYGPRPSKKRHK